MTIEILIPSYNGVSAYEALGKALEASVVSLSNTVMESARATVGGEYPEVAATIHTKLLSLATSGLIDGQIGSLHWESWIAEWGSGSEMDTTNPEYEAYKGSVLWNKLRDGNAITGREAGDYPSLDGTTHTSSGLLAGVNLEVLMQTDAGFAAWAHENIGPQAFEPKIPLHFMRQATESNRNLIMRTLNEVIGGFNFGDFFM